MRTESFKTDKRTREGWRPEQIRNMSFEEILDRIGHRRAMVLKAMREIGVPVSSEDIARHLNVPHHWITPRVLELRQMSIIEWAGEGTSTAGKKVSLWRIKSMQMGLNV